MTNDNRKRIAAPSDFPVSWTDPADAEMAWRHERWHAPDALSPLSFEIVRQQYSGMRRAAAAAGEAWGIDCRQMNGYLYFTFRRLTADDPRPLGDERQPAFEENHALWDGLWLPRIQDYLMRWEAFDREHADAHQLLSHLDESLVWFQHCWEMHNRVDLQGRWTEFARRRLGLTAEQARDFVVGWPNKSLESDDALRALAAKVGTSTSLSIAFALPADEVLAAVSVADDAADFEAEFAAYVHQFGRRSDNFEDIALPTWREDPQPVVAMIKMYLREQTQDAGATRQAAFGDKTAL
jgi:hypothetical protein